MNEPSKTAEQAAHLQQSLCQRLPSAVSIRPETAALPHALQTASLFDCTLVAAAAARGA